MFRQILWAELAEAAVGFSPCEEERVQGVWEGWLDFLWPKITVHSGYIEARSEHTTFEGWPNTSTYLSLTMTGYLIKPWQELILLRKGVRSWNETTRGKNTGPWKTCPARADYRNCGKEGSWDNWLPDAQESQKITSEEIKLDSQCLWSASTIAAFITTKSTSSLGCGHTFYYQTKIKVIPGLNPRLKTCVFIASSEI